jgi:hypothetical protein
VDYVGTKDSLEVTSGHDQISVKALLPNREGCQYSDPSLRSLVLMDQAAQEVPAPEPRRGSGTGSSGVRAVGCVEA